MIPIPPYSADLSGIFRRLLQLGHRPYLPASTAGTLNRLPHTHLIKITSLSGIFTFALHSGHIPVLAEKRSGTLNLLPQEHVKRTNSFLTFLSGSVKKSSSLSSGVCTFAFSSGASGPAPSGITGSASCRRDVPLSGSAAGTSCLTLSDSSRGIGSTVTRGLASSA